MKPTKVSPAYDLQPRYALLGSVLASVYVFVGSRSDLADEDDAVINPGVWQSD